MWKLRQHGMKTPLLWLPSGVLLVQRVQLLSFCSESMSAKRIPNARSQCSHLLNNYRLFIDVFLANDKRPLETGIFTSNTTKVSSVLEIHFNRKQCVCKETTSVL
jgi:hypothetical protein